MKIDPITLEIIANRFDEIQRIMKQRLFRTGYSTILRESFDGGTGIIDRSGRLVGASGVTTHSLPYKKMVEGVLKEYPVGQIFAGDVFISNDPYRGGASHTADVAVATPVFHEGELIAFCTSFGHKPDVGGLAPGSGSPNSRSIFHEGLLIPPVKIYEAGEPIHSVFRIIENNSRTPKLLMGDIGGQIGCTRIGSDLVVELCQKFGGLIVVDAMEALMLSSEKLLRSGLATIPDGMHEAENWMDGDGSSDRPLRVHVKVTKTGDELVIDFSGSDDQSQGPANAVFQTVQAASIGAVLSVVDHNITYNEGAIRPIKFVCPEGKIVNPTFPTAVNSYIPTTHLAFNCVLEALGKFAPEKAIADSGLGLGAYAFGYKGKNDGESYVHYEIAWSALGATSTGDGCSMIFPMIIFETVQPIEIIEREFPVRVVEFSVLPDSAGAGQHRGGLGYRREFEVLEDAEFISRLSQRKFGGHASNGGQSAPLSRTILNPGTDDEETLPGLTQLTLTKGTRVRVEQTGGGGWGPPEQRDPELVRGDVEDGYISAEKAKLDYRV